MKTMWNRAKWALIGTLFAAIPFAASAQNYPNKPITLIVPFAAGGPTDTIARLLGNSMSQTLGQQFVIENVTGAGGTAGTLRLAKSAPDGYTILLHHFSFASSVAFYKNLGYDPNGSVEFLGLINTGPFLFLAKNGFPAKTFQEYIAKIKADGEKINMAHAGIGSGSYKCAMQLMHALGGVKVTLVAYRGTGPAMNDLVAGHVDVLCDQTTNALPQIEGKQVQVYAVTAKTRNPQLPHVPTVDEAGLKGFEITVWHSLYAPKGTPAEAVTKLRTALNKALEDKTVLERFTQLGTTVFPAAERTPEAHAARVKAESEMWLAIAKALNIQAQ